MSDERARGTDATEQLIADLKAALARIEQERDELREWQAKTTVALQRPGGAFYADVPKHIRELVGKLDAAEQRLAALQGWQPIETAPKDGTDVLLFDGEVVSVGGWLSAADQGAEPDEEHLISPGWWSLDLRDNQPTHWMPLPSPPGAITGTPETDAPR